MEAVGARLGRSSTRYGGPATAFTGPVRKWKKKWVPLSNPNPNPNKNNNSNSNNNNNQGSNNNDNSSHLLVYRWTPLCRDSSPSSEEQPPRKKLRYVPVAVIEDQKQEEAAADDDEKMQVDDADEKPEADVDEAEQEEAEEEKASEKNGAPAGEASGASLDLNLGIKARDGDHGSEAAVEDEGSEQGES